MSSASLRSEACSRILARREDAEGRFADLQASLVYRPKRKGRQAHWLFTAGGLWDTREHCYVQDPDDPALLALAETELSLTIHEGQLEAAEWLSDWLSRWASNAWEGVERVWSTLWLGGRRAGKTWLACAALVLFALLRPGALIWAICPTERKTLELMRKLGNPNGDKRSMMPLRWYRFLKGDDQYGPHFRLMNGSIIQLKTGNVALREGECHFALYNEGQQMEESGFVEVRAATSDFGGMTIVTANPPKAKKGLWIEEFHDDVKRGYKVAFDGTQGRREATMFAFDPRKNPYAEHKSLHALKFETDEKTYARDALGLIVPIGDVAIHAFSKSESVRVPWPGLQDITRQVTKKHCRKVASWLLGSDFDKVPHLATSVSKIFRDPEQPNLLIYFVLYVLYVSEGDEEAMVREIFALELEDGSHLHAKDVVVVGDASGDWQDVQRRRGRHSFDVYRNAGLRVVKPDPKAEDNPRRIDRFAVTNAAFKNAAGYRQTYVHPRCREVIIDLASLERRNGVPYAGSPHAHGVDCVSYPVYRVFCHRRRKGRIGYEGKKPHPFTAGMKSW